MIATLAKVFSILSLREKALVILATAIRFVLVGLDLAGVALVGVSVSVLTGTAISQESATFKFLKILTELGLSATYIWVAVVAVSFFTLKAVASIILNERLAVWSAQIDSTKSSEIFRNILRGDLDDLSKWSSKEVAFGLTQSSEVAFGKSLAASSVILGEVALLLGVATALAVSDFLLFVEVGLFFTLVGVIMNRGLVNATRRQGLKHHHANLASTRLILDVLQSYRQIRTTGDSEAFASEFAKNKAAFAKSSAAISTLGILPRYITEVALMAGLGILVIQRAIDPSSGPAAPTMAIFAAGIFRAVASMVSLQGAFSSLKFVEIGAQTAFELSDSYLSPRAFNSLSPRKPHSIVELKSSLKAPVLQVDNVSYRYKNRDRLVLKDVSFEIPFGFLVSVTGKSGAGKSTLADLLLGLRSPSAGSVKISNIDLMTASAVPGLVAYVPQESSLIEGTLRQNILLGATEEMFTDAQIVSALQMANCEELLTVLPEGLDTKLVPQTDTLSGGQMQRMSLARAFIREPKVLVLDESTSALDKRSADQIRETILACQGQMTVIVIAHSREFLEASNMVISLDRGLVKIASKLL